jgi:tRNA (guanine26-N2/guanine27-N2)-dimethyltransferase
VLEGLAASGLRSIRYAKEIPGLGRIVANDLDPAVVEAMKRNIEYNGEEVVGAKVQPSVGDARLIMMQNPGGFDVVDLDPYGSPSMLLDSAVQAVSEGGLLLVTATDMATLCGNNGEACFGKYGAYPLHRPYCHEMALRILLASIQQHAARYKRYIVPVISCSIDFYVRLCVRVYTSAAEVKNAATKVGYVYQSQGCDSFYWQAVGRKTLKGNSIKYQPGVAAPAGGKCPETGANFIIGGPFWSEAIHDQQVVQGILNMVVEEKRLFPAFPKIQGLLTNITEELPDVPLYFHLHDIAKTLKCSSPGATEVRSALANAGYQVSGTHCNPLGLKTDAPWNVIWDIYRCWVKDHPSKKKGGAAGSEDTPAGKILGKEPEIKADFSRVTQALSKAKLNKVPRYLPNPTPHWGPKSKHTRFANNHKEKNGREEGEGGGGGGEKKGEKEKEGEAAGAPQQ